MVSNATGATDLRRCVPRGAGDCCRHYTTSHSTPPSSLNGLISCKPGEAEPAREAPPGDGGPPQSRRDTSKVALGWKLICHARRRPPAKRARFQAHGDSPVSRKKTQSQTQAWQQAELERSCSSSPASGRSRPCSLRLRSPEMPARSGSSPCPTLAPAGDVVDV
jgi:hypothetical protein